MLAGVVHTTITAWAVIVTCSLLNLVLLWLDHNRNAATNVLLLVAAICQTSVLVVCWATGAYGPITVIHIFMLGLAFAGFALYSLNRKRALAGAIVINLAVCIGFVPLWADVLRGANVECLETWALIALASVLGLVRPIAERNWVAALFPLRSALTAAVVVALTLVM